jgi:hypothetical protein
MIQTTHRHDGKPSQHTPETVAAIDIVVLFLGYPVDPSGGPPCKRKLNVMT